MMTINKMKKVAKENGIQIKGIDKIPVIKMSPIYFDHEDELYEADSWFMTYSDFGGGKIEPLAKVSSQYKLVQHRDVVAQIFENLIEQKFPIDTVNITVTENGGKLFARFRSKDGIEIEKDDIIKPEVILTNSCDTSKRFYLNWGAFRLVCSNGMVIPDKRFAHKAVRKLHKKGTLDYDTEMKDFNKSFSSLTEAIGVFKEYTKLSIDEPTLEDIFKTVGVTESQKKTILSLPLRGDKEVVTLEELMKENNADGWKAYNTFTQWTTDYVKNPSTQIEKTRKAAMAFDNLLNQ